MIYSLRYHNEQSFMKEWAKDPSIKIESEGKTLTTNNTYKKTSVPGTAVNFAPKFAENKMQIAMTQEELNKAVKELEYYVNGVQITEAPLGTQDHAFWKSEHAYLFIEKGEGKLDDEFPKDRIMIAAMRKDKSFYIKGETGKPPVRGIVKWILTPLDGKTAQVVDEQGDAMKASKLLFSMDYETQLSILKILGKNVSDKTDPEIVKAMLFNLITTEKDMFASDGITYLQKFLSLATGSNDDININALVNDSKKFFEKRTGYYYYGEIKLGKNIEEVVAFLKNDNDLLFELQRKNKK